MKQKINNSAFTLLELIIVMGIIGVLSVIALVALGNRSVEARNAKRLADMRALILAMNLQCQDDTSLLACSRNASSTPGSPMDVLSSCQDPGDYTKFSIANDPKDTFLGVCDEQKILSGEGCNYSLGLVSGSAPYAYDPCDPHIVFALEGDTITYGCAENQGTTQGITSLTECQ